MGVIYDPITRSCYFAEENYGAYLNDKKIYISKQSNFTSSAILMDHGSSKRSNRDFLLALTKVTNNNGAPVLRLGQLLYRYVMYLKELLKRFLVVEISSMTMPLD